MRHATLRRGAARRSVKLDSRSQVRYGNGSHVKGQLATLRELRPGMTDSAFAFAFRAVVRNRRCTRQDVRAEIDQMMPGEQRSQRAIRALRVAIRINQGRQSREARRRSVRWLGDFLDRVAQRRSFRHPKHPLTRIEKRRHAFDPDHPRSAFYLWEPGCRPFPPRRARLQ